MSDDGWEGLNSGDDAAYSEYLGQGATAPARSAPAPTPVGPLVSPLNLGAVPPAPPARRGLGDFTPMARCELVSLARLSYLFLSNVNQGETSKALAVLGVFRFLFNDSRATIAPGFAPELQAILPTSVPDVSWSAAMQRAMGLSLVGALGASNAALRAAVANLPGNMAALAGWFPTFQATLAPGDASIADYANAPIVTTLDYAAQVGRIARDDLQACAAPAATAPSPAPAPTGATPPPTSPVYRPGQIPGVPSLLPIVAPGTPGTPVTSSGGSTPAPSSGGGTGLLTIGVLALVAYGGYLAYKDVQAKKGGSMGALPPNKSWLPQRLGPQASEFERLNARAQRDGVKDGTKVAREVDCIPTVKTKRSFSMDEWGGPSAEKLNAAIVRFSEQVKGPGVEGPLGSEAEHEIEDTYFRAYTQALREHGAKPGACE